MFMQFGILSLMYFNKVSSLMVLISFIIKSKNPLF